MAMKKYRFVGLDRDVWLPDDILVEIKIIPTSATNVRSRQPFSGQTLYTQHETANFNAGAGADMHYRYLMGNPSPAAGYNFVVDDKKIIQLTPMNEVTWAAGTAEGNKYGYHIELCVNNDINHTVARKNAAALAGGVLAAKGWDTSKLIQHNYWTGKNCPMLLRQNGLWPKYVNQVASYIAAAKAAASGVSVPTPAPTPVGSIVEGDYVKTIDALNLRKGAGTGFTSIKVLPAGVQGRVVKDASGAYTQSGSGHTWFNLSIDGVSGWAAADWLVEVAAPAPPKPAPTPAPTPQPTDPWPYPDPVVPSFWSELMKEGVTHVFAGDTLWVRTNDLYEVKEGGTPRLQLAIKGSKEVGPRMAPKLRFRGAAVGQSAMDKKAYVITPGLTKVAMEDLNYVDDEDVHEVSADEAAKTLVEVLNDVLKK